MYIGLVYSENFGEIIILLLLIIVQFLEIFKVLVCAFTCISIDLALVEFYRLYSFNLNITIEGADDA
jgi:hypothetical protein